MYSTRSGLIQDQTDNLTETDPPPSKKELFGKIGPAHLRAWHFHRLSGNDRAVDVALEAHNLRGDGVVWPSLKTIAKMTGTPHDTHIVRSIGRLEKAGRLKRHKVRGAKGRGDGDEHTLIPWPATSDLVGSMDSTSNQNRPSTSDQIRSQRVTKSGHLKRGNEEIMDASHPEEREGQGRASSLQVPDSGDMMRFADDDGIFGPPREAMTDSERESLDIIFEMNLAHSKRQTDTAYRNLQAETPSPNGKKSPIPPDWEPDADGIAFAKECHPDICVYEEVQKFRDHYLGTGGQKEDWDAAWRSWCWKYERFECR
jgi:hypothetical protein